MVRLPAAGFGVTTEDTSERRAAVKMEMRGQEGPRVDLTAARWAQLLYVWLSLLLLAPTGATDAQTSDPRDLGHRYEKKANTSPEEAIKELSSNDADKRLEAVKVLSTSKDPQSVAALIKAVGDSDVRIQAKAIAALGNMRATEATLVLTQYLFLRTTDANMKQLILSSLGKIGDTRAARPIIEFLQRDLDASTRGTAVFALGELGSAEAADALSQIAQADGDPAVRRLANEALSKIDIHRAGAGTDAKGSPAALSAPPAPLPQHP